jgi:hypothetical protein
MDPRTQKKSEVVAQCDKIILEYTERRIRNTVTNALYRFFDPITGNERLVRFTALRDRLASREQSFDEAVCALYDFYDPEPKTRFALSWEKLSEPCRLVKAVQDAFLVLLNIHLPANTPTDKIYERIVAEIREIKQKNIPSELKR